MKTHLIAIAATTLLTAMLDAQEPQNPTINLAPAKTVILAAKDVTPDEAEKLIASTPGLIILDVRTEEEFTDEHIKGATNANAHGKDFEKTVAALDQTKPVLIHCASGRRSAMALKKLGGKVNFPAVYHLAEGFSGWKKAGKPIVSQPLPGQKKPEQK